MKMNLIKFKLLIFTSLVIFISACSAQKKDSHPGVQVKIKTTAGDIIIKLYDETPLHQKNFIKLVNEKYYDGTLFHRVIKDFMIQAGDPDSRTAKKGQSLGSGGPDYTIDAEFNPILFHKKGALSAARTGDEVNPEKKSSGSQFYIVQGKTYKDEELLQLEKQLGLGSLVPLVREYIQKPENSSIMEKIQAKQKAGDQAGFDRILDSVTLIIKAQHPELKGFKFSEEQKKVYKTIGGTPFLDMNYTVFGEVIEGLDIVDKISLVKTDQNDRPVDDIKIISMEILK